MTTERQAPLAGGGQQRAAADEGDQRVSLSSDGEAGPAQHPRFVPLLVAFLTFCTTYVLAYVSKLPVLRYLPLDRTWTLMPPGDRLAMGYYGLLLLSLIAFFLAFGVASLPPIRRVLEARLIARVLSVAVACAAFGALALVAIAELLRL